MGFVGKIILKIVTIVLIILDIAVGWFKFYQTFYEITTKDVFCERSDLYWQLFAVFEGSGTILAVAEIYYIVREIKKDRCCHDECFGRTFILIVLIYLLSVIPGSILEIIFRELCVCSGSFSVEGWRRNTRDVAKGFLSGISVILMQVILHLTEIYYRGRRLWTLCTTMAMCCRFAPKDNDGEGGKNTNVKNASECSCDDSTSADDDDDDDDGCCKGVMMCFVISLILVFVFIALYVVEILYIFCEPVSG
ncbi:uncharacterized protein LOC128220695 [Mya arenaria]|uniref:uncharacterized protein LOC128220695 n=1 Tax=Mya arenaria TaxID=6604 RepID=UPI0022E2A497|nr:uncharacterized protein LOC128220695 [Mya arenaria]